METRGTSCRPSFEDEKTGGKKGHCVRMCDEAMKETRFSPEYTTEEDAFFNYALMAV